MSKELLLALKLIAHSEGRKDKAYQDDQGIWTIGVGTNMEGVNLGRDEKAAIVQEAIAADAGQFVVDESAIVYRIDLAEYGISRRLQDNLLMNDLVSAHHDLEMFRWYESLGTYQKVAVICLRYWLGPTRFRAFKKTIAYLESGDTTSAADEMLDSQAGRRYRTRMLRLRYLMLNNEPSPPMLAIFA